MPFGVSTERLLVANVVIDVDAFNEYVHVVLVVLGERDGNEG